MSSAHRLQATCWAYILYAAHVLCSVYTRVALQACTRICCYSRHASLCVVYCPKPIKDNITWDSECLCGTCTTFDRRVFCARAALLLLASRPDHTAISTHMLCQQESKTCICISLPFLGIPKGCTRQSCKLLSINEFCTALLLTMLLSSCSCAIQLM